MTLSKIFIQPFTRSKTSPPDETAATATPSTNPSSRIVIGAPRTQASDANIPAHVILIKAMPSSDNSECRLMVNRLLLAGSAWYFSSRRATRGSALADAVFAADENIETLLVHDSTLTLTRQDKGAVDWRPLAEKAGAALRTHLKSGIPSISDEVLSLLPDDDVLRQQVQTVIDEEINPGVAGHGGVIQIVKVKGNAVTINMGGGCQGCSSAVLTLKGGIEKSFRDNVPNLGAILDATDHASGSNPYFS